MLVYKCDLCKKILKDREKSVTAGFGWDSKVLCTDCGKPVVKFLLQQKLIEKDSTL